MKSTVGWSMSLTINLGNFESLKVEGWYERSVGSTETAEEAFESIVEVVTREVSSRIEQLERKARKVIS